MPVKINSITQSAFLRRAFGLFTGFRLTLDEVVVPVAVIEDATTPSRSTDKPCFGGAQQAAVVAEFSHASLHNPAGSGVLLLLDTAWIRLSTNSSLQFWGGGRDGTTVNGSYRDSRLWQQAGVPQVPNARILHHTNVAHLGTLRASILYVGTVPSLEVPLGIIIGQGDDLTLETGSLNVGLDVLFMWRERPIET